MVYNRTDATDNRAKINNVCRLVLLPVYKEGYNEVLLST
jgi:hypothetical protein